MSNPHDDHRYVSLNHELTQLQALIYPAASRAFYRDRGIENLRCFVEIAKRRYEVEKDSPGWTSSPMWDGCMEVVDRIMRNYRSRMDEVQVLYEQLESERHEILSFVLWAAEPEETRKRKQQQEIAGREEKAREAERPEMSKREKAIAEREAAVAGREKAEREKADHDCEQAQREQDAMITDAARRRHDEEARRVEAAVQATTKERLRREQSREDACLFGPIAHLDGALCQPPIWSRVFPVPSWEQQVESWSRAVDANIVLADAVHLRRFPYPPDRPCPKPSCIASRGKCTRALFACPCNIRDAVVDSRVDLRREQLLWHPDRFSRCRGYRREAFEIMAKEVFVVVIGICSGGR